MRTTPAPAHDASAGRSARRRRRGTSPQDTVPAAFTMRELGKLTAEQVADINHPVPVTSNGRPIAWLVPLTPAERRRAEMIAAGELRPRRRDDLEAWRPLSAITDGPSLSEILSRMRDQERT